MFSKYRNEKITWKLFLTVLYILLVFLFIQLHRTFFLYNLYMPAIPILMFVLFLAVVQYKNGSINIKHLIVLILLAAILLPPIKFMDNFPKIGMELFIVVFAWLIVIFSHALSSKPVKFYANNVNIWFILLGFTFAFSIAYSRLILDVDIVSGDVFELFKLLYYFLIFTLAANMQLKSNELQKLYMLTLLLFWASSIVALAQFFEIDFINGWLSENVYSEKTIHMIQIGRVVGTSFNPNHYGHLMLIACSMSISGSIIFKQKQLRLMSWACSAFFIFVIFLTRSRSAVISLLILIIVLIMFLWQHKKRFISRSRSFSRALVMVMLSIILLYGMPFDLTARFRILFTDDIFIRVSLWEYHYTMWLESFLFGWGPAKSILSVVVDSEWLLLLRNYGLIGTTVFIMLWVAVYRNLLKINIC